MVDVFAKLIAEKEGLQFNHVVEVINLLNEGATVPFIARYRKDNTGGMEDLKVFQVQKSLTHYTELKKRKLHVISVIEEQDKMTAELQRKIDGCWDDKLLEDLYLPYKTKRKTKAETARQNGLEVLAKIIMKQDRQDYHGSVTRFIKGDIKSEAEAVEGAKFIMAEWMSENQAARNRTRRLYKNEGLLVSKLKKGKEAEGEKYTQYFDYSQKAIHVPSHRFLAIQRASEEGIVSSGIKVDKKEAIANVSSFFIKGKGEASTIVEEALSDAYTRLIKPSIENELIKEIKLKSDQEAIKVFAKNLRQLLMVPPVKDKKVLAIDPGFKSGCKVVCLDERGNLKHNENIFPHPPQKKYKEALTKISGLVDAYKIDAIAIGNGTAGRETESFIQKINFSRDVEVYVVNENGASIYSASSIAREEFPNYDVTVRGAVSIGRRLIDPLAELVKIDAKSIGVGQYQHDVDQSLLKLELDHVVETCVNQVGVNLNTASKYLLQYVSGIGETLANNILEYRKQNQGISSRAELNKVPRLGPKVYQQCAGFLKVEGENLLDSTSVHPEHYSIVKEIAKVQNVSVEALIGGEEIRQNDIAAKINETVGELTLQDILKELNKPGFDPRKQVRKFNFDPNIKSIEDVQEGMILPGLVTNLTNFGAFVDIGIKENGLVHISHITNRFISSPMEELDLNDFVRVKVISVDVVKKRIGLSIKDVK